MKLKVSSNGRYFVDQDGKPFFYLGDTAWLLFQRFDHEELEDYLKDRAKKGFNVIQAYVIRGLDKRHPDGNSSLLGVSPFIDRDATKPNEAYFKNVDHVVNRANQLGLVMGLVAAKSWHVSKHQEQVFDAKNAYTFGKFLGARYKDNAVLWYVGGDSNPDSNEAEVWVAMAKGLKDGSGGSQLVSYHGGGQSSSSTWFHKAVWLDFNSIQSGHPWAAKTYRFVDKDYGLSPAKPTVDMEPPYENHPTGAKTPRIDSHQVRKAAYWNMLAGAAGHGYGALDLFWLYKDSDGPFPKNGFQHWRKALAYEGSGQVGFMRRLFELRPWYKLVPDQSVIAEGQGEGEDLVRAARAEDGSFIVAYLPTGKSVSIQMAKVSGKTVKGQWYDPRSGAWREIGEYPNNGKREFVPPTKGDNDDWVLVLEDASKGFRTAGTVEPNDEASKLTQEMDIHFLNKKLGRGINLGNALEAPKEGAWGVTLKAEYFKTIKKAGFDSVRLPVNWSAHAHSQVPYELDPKFAERVDWAIDQALANQLNIVVNVHHYAQIFSNPDQHKDRLVGIWSQLATRYKARPAGVFFEILNEPHDKLTDDKWNATFPEVLAVVRKTNPTRPVIIGPGQWNSVRGLDKFELPKDDRNLILTVHYYDPHKFTHQGASWEKGSDAWKGTKWTGTDEERAAVRKAFDKAGAWAKAHNVPVYLGEFGAIAVADIDSRGRWTSFVAREAESRGYSWAYWEFCAPQFGAYDQKTESWREPLKAALIK